MASQLADRHMIVVTSDTVPGPHPPSLWPLTTTKELIRSFAVAGYEVTEVRPSSRCQLRG